MTKTKPDITRQLSLTGSQQIAIDALIKGATDAEAAAAATVTRQTVCSWRNHHPLFIAELNRCRREIWTASRDHLLALVPKALDALETALTSEQPNTRAAIKVIELVGLSSESISPSGPTSAKEVLDAEVQRRRQADFDAMISPDGGPVSELERSRVALLWEEQVLE